MITYDQITDKKISEIGYACANGAYHTYECCETCWNKHPNHERGKDYRLDHEDEYYESLEKWKPKGCIAPDGSIGIKLTR